MVGLCLVPRHRPHTSHDLGSSLEIPRYSRDSCRCTAWCSTWTGSGSWFLVVFLVCQLPQFFVWKRWHPLVTTESEPMWNSDQRPYGQRCDRFDALVANCMLGLILRFFATTHAVYTSNFILYTFGQIHLVTDIYHQKPSNILSCHR